MKPEYAAHTPRDAKDPNAPWHELEQHLRVVSRLSSRFARKFGASDALRTAGSLHDAGKYGVDFQEYLWQAYLAKCNGVIAPKRGSVPHAITGAFIARLLYNANAELSDDGIGLELAWVIAAHHAGLHSKTDLLDNLHKKGETELVQGGARIALSRSLLQDVNAPILPTTNTKLEREFLVRMMLSCLVDADYLDTEAFGSPHRRKIRKQPRATLSVLLGRLKTAQLEKMRLATPNPVNEARAEVYANALQKAECPTGFFRLSVPTGGGKTRSSLAFALQHAIHHNLERVIYVVPYLTITQQIAVDFADILGEENILEHHSAVVFTGETERFELENWQKLASENWDARIIITTSVQFLQSLFSRFPSDVRKLHRIAKSVVIFDEAQTLPATLLTPIMDVLHELKNRYQTSIIFCTATQPALDATSGFPELNAVEIAPDPPRLFRTLERVKYHFDWTGWDALTTAQNLTQHQQVLCIVNTRAQAKEIFAELQKLEPHTCIHLSTHLCGAHRKRQLVIIKALLDAKQPLRVISTSLVEAGVDLDFPVVYRALSPLDSIVQAAGRCNRNMTLDYGNVYVFRPLPFVLPSGVYEVATKKTEGLLKRGVDLQAFETFLEYFASLHGSAVTTDAFKIQQWRNDFDYPKVADNFKVIEDTTMPVLIRHYDPKAVREILAQPFNKDTWRRLQPYLVNIYRKQLEPHLQAGLLRPCTEIPIPEHGKPILHEWVGKYDQNLGMLEEVDLQLTVI
jgi:CRISPR-associated endonuclease/helicase Cas3